MELNPINWFSKKKVKEIDSRPIIIKESDNSKNTEEGKAYIASKGSLLMFGVDEEEQEVRNIDKYFNAYYNFPVVTQSVDSTVEQVVQDFRIDGPQKDALMRWAETIKLKDHLDRICRNYLIAGTYWAELIKIMGGEKKKGLGRLKNVATFKHLDPRKMSIVRTRKGKFLCHMQNINGNKLYWGDKPGKIRAKRAGPAEKMFCIKRNVIGDEKYGTSLIHCCLPLLEAKDKLETDLKDVVKRYIAPIIHAKIGNDLHPASADDVDEMATKLEDIYTDTEYATNHLVDMNVLSFEGKGIDFKPVFDHIDSQILVGLQNYSKLASDNIGLSKGGDRGDEIRLREGGRHIRKIQRELASAIEDQVFYYLTGNYRNKLVFEEVEERKFEMDVEILTTLVKNGILTPKKANELLPDQYRDKIPDGLLSDLTQRADIGKDQKVEPDEKVKDNPNDPTKSTNVRDGKRVDKSETLINKKAKSKPQDIGKSKML